LTPNDFDGLADVARRLNEFEKNYNQIAEPFGWNFTRQKLDDMLARLADRQTAQLAAAA
jgi:predicted metalloenzyme YecM